ncbi:hypothetical protein BC828DRAFT_349522 [Blastocladiella britannica]|nr:hypothetical protein BC828DRAFT_349522 [Blastocladiella britannica]
MEPLVGGTCTTELLSPLVQWTKPCVTLALSKGLGLGIVVFGAIVKVPQILKVSSMWSIEGLSYAGFVLESVSSSIFVAYNAANGYPFSTYGEAAFVILQNLALLVLMATIQRRFALAAVFVAAFGVGAQVLSTLSLATLASMQSYAAMPLSLASKFPPIIAVYTAGSSGALSAVTVISYFAGSLARIGTTLKEVDDNVILFSYIANGVLNAVLLSQVLWYWNAKPADPTKKVSHKKSE